MSGAQRRGGGLSSKKVGFCAQPLFDFDLQLSLPSAALTRARTPIQTSSEGPSPPTQTSATRHIRFQSVVASTPTRKKMAQTALFALLLLTTTTLLSTLNPTTTTHATPTTTTLTKPGLTLLEKDALCATRLFKTPYTGYNASIEKNDAGNDTACIASGFPDRWKQFFPGNIELGVGHALRVQVFQSTNPSHKQMLIAVKHFEYEPLPPMDPIPGFDTVFDWY